MDEDAQYLTEPAVGIKELDSSCLGSDSHDKAEHREVQDQLDQEHVTRILLEFLPIIRRMAGIMAFKNPFSLDVEDLTSAGAMGLLSALKRYDP
ncbi:MAG: hypothetical protein H0W49_11915, partial [Nitrospirales bacterium]|nr:hypothetical protein [Nitrospirales bacterium]